MATKTEEQKKIEALEAKLAKEKADREKEWQELDAAKNGLKEKDAELAELKKGKEEALRDVGRLTKELAEEKSARTRAENALAEVEKKLEAAEKDLRDAEAELEARVPGELVEDPLPEIPEELLQEALDAYDIDAKYVLSTGIDPLNGQLVIVTAGGKKVRYFQGDKVEPLTEVEVTGVNKARRKTGRK